MECVKVNVSPLLCQASRVILTLSLDVSTRERTLSRTHITTAPSEEGARYWEARWEKKRPLIELGMADLSLWLRDQATLGIEELRRGGPDPVKAIASRMLNVECKGVAERLERLAHLLGGDQERPAWMERAGEEPPRSAEALLDAQLLSIGELALLSRAFERLASFSFEQRVSLLSELGLREEPKSARAKPELEGRWVALSQQVERERGLLVRRQWLARLPSVSELQRARRAERSSSERPPPELTASELTASERLDVELDHQREALSLTLGYAWGSAPLPPASPLGGVLAQPLRAFEGLAPRRALISPLRDMDVAGSAERPYLVTHERPSQDEWAGLPWSPSLTHSRAGFERQVARSPWRAESPALISGGRVICHPVEGLAYLDASGVSASLSLPVQTAHRSRAERALLCIGGQGPVALVGEWRAEGLLALSLISERGRLYSITGGRIA